jgi:hypothetical protein
VCCVILFGLPIKSSSQEQQGCTLEKYRTSLYPLESFHGGGGERRDGGPRKEGGDVEERRTRAREVGEELGQRLAAEGILEILQSESVAVIHKYIRSAADDHACSMYHNLLYCRVLGLQELRTDGSPNDADDLQKQLLHSVFVQRNTA